MNRTVYLVVFNSPLFPAHWALWIPHEDSDGKGKLLNINGSAATGFDLEFERNYSLRNCSRTHQTIELAKVPTQYVVDVKGDGSESTDSTAHDYIEEVALGIAPPAPSLVSVSSQVRYSRGCATVAGAKSIA